MPPHLTRQQARRIILRACGSGRLASSHPYFRRRLAERGYVIRDAYRVIRTGKMSVPVWRPQYGNFEVRYEGRTSEERRTRVVVAVTHTEGVYLVNIIPL